MLQDLKLRSLDLPGEIWICPSVQELILSYKQVGCITKEAGGILMGYRRGSHIEIVEATAPLPMDIRHRHSFERKDPGHQATCDARWESSNGTIRYLGEWHTHPTPRPTPSSIDCVEWAKLLKFFEEQLTFVIAGTTEWYIKSADIHWTVDSPS